MIELKIKTVTVDVSGVFSVLLVDNEEKIVLPIAIGPLEAQNTALPLHGVKPSRPMTPDLLVSAIGKLGGALKKVVITDIRDNTFFAEIYIEQNGREIVLDARPSDAIALAIRTEIPIYMKFRLREFTYDMSDIKLQ